MPEKGARHAQRGRGGSSSSSSISRRGHVGAARPKGLFDNKVWYCDCTPRLPAEQFTVKKASTNKGRAFLTCQQSPGHRCAFFLWSDEAKMRAASSLLGHGRYEAQEDGGPGAETPAGGGGRRQSDGRFAAPPTLEAPAAGRAGVKRRAHEAGFADDGGGGEGDGAGEAEGEGKDEDEEAWAWDLTGAEEKQLAEAAEASLLRTPQKAQHPGYSLSAGVYATPVSEVKRSPRKLPWLLESGAMMTSRNKSKSIRDYFHRTPSKHAGVASSPSRRDVEEEEEDEEEESAVQQQVEMTCPDPPSPSPATRFKPLFSAALTTNHHHLDEELTTTTTTTTTTTPPPPPPPPPPTITTSSSKTLTDEVLQELAPTLLPPAQMAKLKRILQKHEARAEGLRKGRDLSRVALKAKEAQLRASEARVASLLLGGHARAEVEIESESEGEGEGESAWEWEWDGR